MMMYRKSVVLMGIASVCVCGVHATDTDISHSYEGYSSAATAVSTQVEARKDLLYPKKGPGMYAPIRIPIEDHLTGMTHQVHSLYAGEIPTRELVRLLETNEVEILIDIIDQISMQDTGSLYVHEAFASLLEHPHEEVRMAVMDAVFMFDTIRPLLPALAKRLYDPCEDIREDAMDVMADIETREMIDILVINMTNHYADVRENSEFYLSFWTDETFTTVEEWREWWASNRATFVFE